MRTRTQLFLSALPLLAAGCQAPQAVKRQQLVLFPPPPAEPRVQFLTTLKGADDIVEPKSSFSEFILGDDDKRETPALNKPYGLAARNGSVYVCDTKALALFKMDLASKSFSVIGTDGPGRLRKPINVAIDGLGYKFVVDPERRQVVVFGPDDSYVTAFSLPEPSHPVDLAVTDTEVYVLDNKTPQVVVFDRVSGKVVRSFGRNGAKPGEFHLPSSIALGPDGSVYVSDTMNWRVQKLTASGEPVESFGTDGCVGMPGYRIGEFGRPRGIRVDSEGILYVVDAATEIVQMFDSDGRPLMRFGGPGDRPGSLCLPSSLAIDETSLGQFGGLAHEKFRVRRLLFVASQYGQRPVSVYALGSFADGFVPPANEIETIAPIAPTTPASEDEPSRD
jgi:sugar lactone lactonase YvrE